MLKGTIGYTTVPITCNRVYSNGDKCEALATHRAMWPIPNAGFGAGMHAFYCAAHVKLVEEKPGAQVTRLSEEEC